MTDSEHVGKTCQIDVLIEEHDERTRAKARLSWAGQADGGCWFGATRSGR